MMAQIESADEAHLRDAYGPEEQAMGLYYYLEDQMEFPFTIRQGKRDLAVPLSQLKVTHANSEKTIEAVDDWRYWVTMGYQFG